MESMNRNNMQWRLTAVRVGPGEDDVVLAVHGRTARYRAAAWLWRAAWDRRPAGNAIGVPTWTVLEAGAAVGMAWLVATLSATAASGVLAAALTAALVVVVSRWTRSRVAVMMPLWASAGMTVIRGGRATTDRGTGGALTPQVWQQLCAATTNRNADDRDGLADAVRDWAAAREATEGSRQAATEPAAREVRLRAARVESLVA